MCQELPEEAPHGMLLLIPTLHLRSSLLRWRHSRTPLGSLFYLFYFFKKVAPWGGAIWEASEKPSLNFKLQENTPWGGAIWRASCRENQANPNFENFQILLRCLTHKFPILFSQKNQNSTPWDGATWRAQIEPVWNSKFSKNSTNTRAHAQPRGSFLRPQFLDFFFLRFQTPADFELQHRPPLELNCVPWNSRPPLGLSGEGAVKCCSCSGQFDSSVGRSWWIIRSPHRRTNEAIGSRPFQEFQSCITKQGAPLFLLIS